MGGLSMKEIITYYKEKDGTKRGCIVGIIDSGRYAIGWSLYNKKLEKEAGKPFKKKFGRTIAENRALKYIRNSKFGLNLNSIPSSLLPLAEQMAEKCRRIINS